MRRSWQDSSTTRRRRKIPRKKKVSTLAEIGLADDLQLFSGMRRNAENSHFDEAPLAGNNGECLKLSYLIMLLLGAGKKDWWNALKFSILHDAFSWEEWLVKCLTKLSLWWWMMLLLGNNGECWNLSFFMLLLLLGRMVKCWIKLSFCS